MKTYKLWIEIEEYDPATGEYRNVTTDGEVAPVPIAEFSTLTQAIRLAEFFAMDGDAEPIGGATWIPDTPVIH